MLWSAPDRELGQIAPAADETSGGRPAPRPEPEQGLKRPHRRLAPVMAKDEFVEIDLQVMPADAVIGADEPLLQVADGAVRKRHHGRNAAAQGAPEGLRALHVPHGQRRQVLEAFQAVGVDRRARRDVVLDECDHRRLFEVRDASRAAPARHRHSGVPRPIQLAQVDSGRRLRDPGLKAPEVEPVAKTIAN